MKQVGWIKLHKKFENWEWFHKSDMVHLFIYLLINANHVPNNFEGRMIQTGQLPTSIKALHKHTGISEQSIRTYIKRLKSTGELTSESTNKFSIITICNYNSYQIKENKTNKQINKQTNKQLTNNQQTTNNTIINKEVKNDKNKDISHRIETFKKTVKDYVQENLKYKPVESEFIGYWTELNKTGKTFRYENERFFDMGKRLGTFLNRYTKKQRYNMTDETTRPEYKVLSSFKDFGAFIDYYKPYQQKAKDSLLPYSREIKDLAYAFINQNIRLDQAVTEFNKLRS